MRFSLHQEMEGREKGIPVISDKRALRFFSSELLVREVRPGWGVYYLAALKAMRTWVRGTKPGRR